MKQSSLFAFVAAALLASTFLTACVPVGIATGAAAATGIAAGQEGGLKGAVADTSIRAHINDLWFRYNVDMFSKVKLTVDQGRVLLTGIVQQPEHRVQAVRLVWQVKGVKQVINEIQVGNEQSFTSIAQDKWITSQLRSQMILNEDIQSINYSIDTVKGVVYLMGVAQNPKELNRVIRLAQRTKWVKQVVSYVKMVGEPIVKETPGSVAPPATQTDGSVSTTTTTNSSSGITPDMMAPSSAPLTPSKSDIQTEVLPP